MAAFGVVLFVFIHVALVLISGVFNNMRSMVTGWYDTGREEERHG
jgi:thiosulfate reductase cytochrome b subunit